MFFDNKYNNKKPELSKLISFAFDLYEDKLDYFNSECDLFPRWYTYNHHSYEIARISDGIVWGKRGYANHSDSSVFTEIGITVGKVVDEQLIFYYAISLNTNNKKQYVIVDLLDYDRQEKYQPELKPSASSFTDLNEEERTNIFIRSMGILGFNVEDVKSVINGTMTAREAYMNIAPEDKKYKQWVDIGREYFEFDKNMAIRGRFGQIRSFDEFPFPFEEEVVIDCSKAKTSCIRLDNNIRKVRLIHVNENKESILYATLRNAIIDEVIDLSKVDATGTKFGHQRICNLMYSIAKLEDMDLTLACDIDGNIFKTDEKGRARTDGFGDPILEEIIISEDEANRTLKIFAM